MSKGTPLPKLPTGWFYVHHENCGDGSGTPWIEVTCPDDGSYVLVESNTSENDDTLKWTCVEIYVANNDDPYDMNSIGRFIKRLGVLRTVAKKMRLWAVAENKRPHDPWGKENDDA